MDINVELLQRFINFLIKKTSDVAIKSKIISNKELAEELHQPIIRKSKKRQVYSPFVDNVLGADLIGMQLMSKFNKGTRFLLCVIDIFSKCAWVIPLKDKNVLQLLILFNKFFRNLIANQTKYNQIKAASFYNRSMKSWLESGG